MSTFPFSVEFQKNITPDALDQDEHVLAAIGFSSQAELLGQSRPVFSSGLVDLDNATLTEVWKSPEPVKTSQTDNLMLSWNSEVLFGFIQVSEENHNNLIEATQAAYQQILGTLESSEYPKLLRIWNYFSSINDESSGLERYREFCLGRQKALDQFGNLPYAPPAATAIGTNSGDLQIYFIAARQAGIQLENPRQTPAFLYPREYGEVSPAFSRATYKPWEIKNKSSQDHLYISGTASIVGHKSQHHGDAVHQLKETLGNVEALIRHGHETLDLSISRLEQVSHLKVYLRDASLLDLVKSEMEECFANIDRKKRPPILYLQGDVCREDLLVEVEAGYLASA